jgi:glycogen debranching enzyme
VSASDPTFSRRDHFLLLRRYWRGPTWLNAAWLLWLGLVRLGYQDEATEMANRIGRTVAREGLREYYDPYTGDGMGATDFSWSSLVMELIDPDPAAAHSHVLPAGSARTQLSVP